MSDRDTKIYALKLKYEAEIAEYTVDIENYLNHSAGVAEHPHIIDSLDGLISKLANSEDKLNSVIRNFSRDLYQREL
jgi:hypothetical protein|tara:strand:+ start:433 stop:663 length:231 start_codon:yes stop_codon:yes gene_type:complete